MLDTTRPGELPYGIPPPAHRLPAATHIGGVHLLVSDLARARTFYEQVLGLRPLVVGAEQATFGSHGDDAALVTLRTSRGVTSARAGARSACITSRSCCRIAPRSGASRRICRRWAFASAWPIIWSAKRSICRIPTASASRSTPTGHGTTWRRRRPPARHGHRSARHPERDRRGRRRSLGRSSGGHDDGPRAPARRRPRRAPKRSTIARSASTRPCGTILARCSCRPAAITIISARTRGRRGPSPSATQAQLLAWELIVPSDADVAAVGRSLQARRLSRGADGGRCDRARSVGHAGEHPRGAPEPCRSVLRSCPLRNASRSVPASASSSRIRTAN